jgi:lipopolysaccharide transport system ATP-binding protein
MTALLTLTDVSMHFSREADSRYAVFGGIDLKVGAGECVALIGRNGSGKSTLLRVMAKIFAPTSGSVSWAPGVAVSLLTLGLGFRPDLSGRDNAYLSCLLLGLSRDEATQSLSQIEAFCDIGTFFDEPVRSYSAGMRARLGFGTALMNRSQVILIDETLSVGDQQFREKAREALERELAGDRSVVLVSHAEQQVQRLCQRAVLLENGVIAAEGSPDDVLAEYAATIGKTP